MDTVIRECPGLELNAFRGYLAKTEGRSAVERGFDWYVHRRALTYVFILDRAAEADDSGDVIDISVWKDFEALYIQFYEARSKVFIHGMLEVRSDSMYRSSTFTYASSIFLLRTERWEPCSDMRRYVRQLFWGTVCLFHALFLNGRRAGAEAPRTWRRCCTLAAR